MSLTAFTPTSHFPYGNSPAFGTQPQLHSSAVAPVCLAAPQTNQIATNIFNSPFGPAPAAFMPTHQIPSVNSYALGLQPPLAAAWQTNHVATNMFNPLVGPTQATAQAYMPPAAFMPTPQIPNGNSYTSSLSQPPLYPTAATPAYTAALQINQVAANNPPFGQTQITAQALDMPPAPLAPAPQIPNGNSYASLSQPQLHSAAAAPDYTAALQTNQFATGAFKKLLKRAQTTIEALNNELLMHPVTLPNQPGPVVFHFTMETIPVSPAGANNSESPQTSIESDSDPGSTTLAKASTVFVPLAKASITLACQYKQWLNEEFPDLNPKSFRPWEAFEGAYPQHFTFYYTNKDGSRSDQARRNLLSTICKAVFASRGKKIRIPDAVASDFEAKFSAKIRAHKVGKPRKKGTS